LSFKINLVASDINPSWCVSVRVLNTTQPAASSFYHPSCSHAAAGPTQFIWKLLPSAGRCVSGVTVGWRWRRNLVEYYYYTYVYIITYTYQTYYYYHYCSPLILQFSLVTRSKSEMRYATINKRDDFVKNNFFHTKSSFRQWHVRRSHKIRAHRAD